MWLGEGTDAKADEVSSPCKPSKVKTKVGLKPLPPPDFKTNDMRILHLTLKKKWFDMIASGEKKEEYREIKPYWIKRMRFDVWNTNPFDVIKFRNGYSANAPEIEVKSLGIEIRTGNPAWGAEPGKEYFVIKLGELLTTPQGE